MKFGKGTADKAGRAMKNRTPDKMGRAMVKKFSMGGAMAGKGAKAAEKGSQRGMPARNPRYGQSRTEPYEMPEGRVTVEEIGDFSGPRMRKGGMAYSKGGKAKSGGSYRKAADGVAHKGKTKGKMVKMMKGGYCG
jgi:hypothetical protein